MCQTICKNKKNKFFISSLTNPQTIEVCKVRAEPIGVEIIVGDPLSTKLDATFMGALIPYPTTCGRILDYTTFLSECKVTYVFWRFKSGRSERRVRFSLQTSKVPTVFIADLLSLTLLTPPGELGADIVVGNSQVPAHHPSAAHSPLFPRRRSFISADTRSDG